MIAREAECREIWEIAQYLPAHLRSQVGYPMLTVDQARTSLFKIFAIQNTRTEHSLEGFPDVLEWYDPATGKMMPQNTIPQPLPPGAKVYKRKQMPVERAAELLGQCDKFTPVSPEIIIAFLSHTQRKVVVEDSGEIIFRHQGRDYVFRSPGYEIPPGTKLLGYHHEDDPAYLHLTDAKGGVAGTWLRIDRIRANDKDALAKMIQYTAGALKMAREAAEELAAPERAELESLRSRNAELMASADCHQVVDPAPQSVEPATSTVARVLTAAIAKRDADQQQTKADATADAKLAREQGQAAIDALLSPRIDADADANALKRHASTDDFLNAISK